MRLAHLRFPGLTTYQHAASLQESLIQKHFLAKDILRTTTPQPSKTAQDPRLPDPTIITAEFAPVYTFGRRQRGRVSPEQRLFLEDGGKASVIEALRGGEVTYHGPGQLVAYPIIDLRRHRITPRCYVRLLEETVMAVCARFGIPNVQRTDDPGVWIRGGQRKICALGVQVRRGITSHGVGFNCHDRDGWLSWGFGRIVACGLEGKETTWLARETEDEALGFDVGKVAGEFVRTFAEKLGDVEEVYDFDVSEVEADVRHKMASTPNGMSV